MAERGFTLVELMVVVLIIAVLLAIAVPTFLGAQSRARDRSTQSSLRTALVAAKIVYAEKLAFTDAGPGDLTAIEPSLSYRTSDEPSLGAKSVSVNAGPAGSQAWYAAALSKTDTCFYIKDTAMGGTRYATAAAADCTATKALALADTSYRAEGW